PAPSRPARDHLDTLDRHKDCHRDSLRNSPLTRIQLPISQGGLHRSDTEREAIAALQRFTTDGFGYRIQATRPQTIGYALSDSPAGLAGWIYEKFEAWTDSDGDPETALTRDEMLDDISLYWLTNTAASSARLYRENAQYGMNLGVVELPVGVSIFPGEIFRTPRSWAEKVYPNLIHWNELDRGGHFAAFEQPTLFVQELRACFRSLRDG
ncbi:MAG TPA: hypothetical protein VGO20_16360, partial [Arenibaculum sp.]|nr:hypothetical protein [Arenibaculum sp.]